MKTGTAPAPTPALGAVEVFDGGVIGGAMARLMSQPGQGSLQDLSKRITWIHEQMPLPVVRDASTGPVDDAVAERAYENGNRVQRFLSNQLGRNSWDDRGTPLRIRVHMPSDTAAWQGRAGAVAISERGALAAHTTQPDVLFHEVGHAIYDAEMFSTPDAAEATKQDVLQHAVNESWADVFAATVDRNDWKVGQARGGAAIRDLAHPQIGNTAELARRGGVVEADAITSDGKPPAGVSDPHLVGGIPTLAAVRVADDIGRTKMGRIWYRALTEHLTPEARFPEAAQATLRAAQELYGADSAAHRAVTAAWKSVGVLGLEKTG